MNALAALEIKRNRAWPWPESSFGLTPMFGEDGWCRACGVPKHEQTGSIVLQRRSVRVEGSWVPYWRYDVHCVALELSQQIGETFDVNFRPVLWHASSPGEAVQIVHNLSAENWFDHTQLTQAAEAKHGESGSACPECGTWKWNPLGYELLPAMRPSVNQEEGDVLASPEWFGSGLKAFRLTVFKTELAHMIAAASPRDYSVVPQ